MALSGSATSYTGYIDEDLLDPLAPVRETFWRRWAKTAQNLFRTTTRAKTDEEIRLAAEVERLLDVVRSRDKALQANQYELDAKDCEIDNAKRVIDSLNEHIVLLRSHAKAQGLIDARRIAMAEFEYKRLVGGNPTGGA